MGKFMKKCFLLICAGALIFALATSVSADTGPKTSVRVAFENLGSEPCYATLLSQQTSTGPASVWDGDPTHAYHSGNFDYAALDYETWKAFAEYQDADGYYFLQIAWRVDEAKTLDWTYYPPSDFKILLYWPETGAFAVSGVCQRYAFDTYYTVDMQGVTIDAVTPGGLDAYRSYPYGQELASLLARIGLTILIEMALALLFGFREGRALALLAGVNVVTQVLLNVFLNLQNYSAGPQAFTATYLLLEAGVFVLEAGVYCTALRKLSARPRRAWYYILYAFAANAASFGAGLAIAHWLPGIF